MVAMAEWWLISAQLYVQASGSDANWGKTDGGTLLDEEPPFSSFIKARTSDFALRQFRNHSRWL